MTPINIKWFGLELYINENDVPPMTVQHRTELLKKKLNEGQNYHCIFVDAAGHTLYIKQEQPPSTDELIEIQRDLVKQQRKHFSIWLWTAIVVLLGIIWVLLK